MAETKLHGMPSVRSEPPGQVFTELFRAHFRYVHVQLRRLGVAPAAVDDAVQEVFLVVLRRYAEAPVVHVRGWLFAIVRRIAYRQRRGAERRHRLADALAGEGEAAGAMQDEVVVRQAARVLGAFIERLPEERREVFILAELEQMTAPEIARTLGIKENTVSSRLRAARQEFDRTFARVRLREGRVTGEVVRDERALLLSRARRADEPGPAARQRSWALLIGLPELQGLGLASEAPIASGHAVQAAAVQLSFGTRLGGAIGGALGKSTAWVVALGAGGVLIAASEVRGPERDEEAMRASVVAAPVEVRGEHAAPVGAVAAVGATVSAEPGRTGAGNGGRRARERAVARDELQRETALLGAARAAIRGGELAAARELLARHGREFPAGALVEERALSTIAVLCGLGEREAARRAAAELAAERPGLARRAGELCREDSATAAGPAGD